MLSENLKFVAGLAPAADRWNTGPSTDIVSLESASEVTFLVYQSGGTTGCAAVTVDACDDFTPSNTTAIAFRYRKIAGSTSSDSAGAVTAATASGFVTTAAEAALYEIHVRASELPAGKPNVRLTCTESVNDPVNGSVVIILDGLRYGGLTQPTAIAVS